MSFSPKWDDYAGIALVELMQTDNPNMYDAPLLLTSIAAQYADAMCAEREKRIEEAALEDELERQHGRPEPVEGAWKYEAPNTCDFCDEPAPDGMAYCGDHDGGD